MTLTAVFEEGPPGEGGGFVAYTEELPGAISEGDTLEEARDNLRDAIELCWKPTANWPASAVRARRSPEKK